MPSTAPAPQHRADVLFGASTQANAYSRHRPSYNADVVAAVLSRNAAPPAHVLDVGCGSGQLTRALAAALPATSVVEGVDACASQVERAAPGDGGAAVSFRVADACATGAAAASADLLTVAQALHWLVEPVHDNDGANIPPRPFYVEAARVLRPGGAFAAVSYGVASLESATGTPLNAASAALRAFHDALNWNPARSAAINGMQGLDPRAREGFRDVDRLHASMATPTSLDGVVGYLSSWSSVAAAIKKGDSTVLDRARADLAAGLAADGVSDGSELAMVWPVTVLLATRA